MRAIQITEFGGPEVLKVAELELPVPASGELLIEVERAGVNFADTHQRKDEYLAKSELPLIPGVEVAGVVSEGPRAGERVVAYTGSGGYAQFSCAREELCFPVPEGLDLEIALALFVQGITAHHMLTTCAHLGAGESVVVHSAAGGTGSLSVQLAKAYGAGRVIATASTKAKREFTLGFGADIAVDGTADGLRERLIAANNGSGLDVVLDMAGGDVFRQSLLALAPFGRIVAYGVASRQQNEVKTARLMRSSTAVVGFWLRALLERPAMIQSALDSLFAFAADGQVAPLPGGVFALEEAAHAHTELQARRTTGKLLLDPTRSAATAAAD